LESAFFEPTAVRRSAAAHNLHSESSFRFEREVDPSGILVASERAMRLIEELAGGRPDGPVIVAGTLPVESKRVSIRLLRCRSLLGTDISAEEVRDALIRLGLTFAAERGDFMDWKTPSYRRDLSREADLIEEVARIIGIKRIEGRISAAPAPPSEADDAYDFRSAVRQKLYALGLSEARTGTLVSEKMLWSDGASLRLRNPLGEDHAFLRTSLLPGLIAALERNIRHGAQSIALYEIGRTFHSGASTEEQETLAFVLSGWSGAKSWRQDEVREFDWYDAKGVLESLTPGSLTCVRFESCPHLALSVEVLAGSNSLGMLGQLAPAFARTLDANKPVLVGEVSLEMLQNIRQQAAFRSIPKFPSVTRDIAVVCPIALSYGEIESELRKANEQLLVEIKPFNIYRDPSGEKLPADRKSIAISLTFRARERTLGNEEVNDACKRLKQHLNARLAVDFRE
jgi:phenylalanyl-tRNA synthetase beta chain